MAQANSNSWKKIFDKYDIHKHSFDKEPFSISAEQIKTACQDFINTGAKEVRILCTQTRREDRPDIFNEVYQGRLSKERFFRKLSVVSYRKTMSLISQIH